MEGLLLRNLASAILVQALDLPPNPNDPRVQAAQKAADTFHQFYLLYYISAYACASAAAMFIVFGKWRVACVLLATCFVIPFVLSVTLGGWEIAARMYTNANALLFMLRPIAGAAIAGFGLRFCFRAFARWRSENAARKE
jgi:hypothetical protein